MPTFGMLRRMGLVTTEVSEEFSASIIRVSSISELGAPLAVIIFIYSPRAPIASYC
jgi:hypothetical protein